MELTVTTGQAIPRLPDEFIDSVDGFGFAWLDNQGKGIVAAIHPDFDKIRPKIRMHGARTQLRSMEIAHR